MELGKVFFVFLGLCMCANASQILPCRGQKVLEESDRVSLSNCDKPPCRLKRKTTVTIELKFAPQHDVTKIKNSVHAQILGVPFPFIGVDGNTVCSKIFDASTGAKVNCPLKEGHEYVYKDEFKILEIYPKIKLQVHWALKDENDADIMCFEVPARITS